MSLVVRVGAAIAAALGAWVSLGAVAIAPLHDTATRVAILPPFWVLGAAILGFLVLVFGVGLGPVRSAPLFAGLLPVLALLPGRVPAAFLLWQGVPAAMLWVGIATAVLGAGPIHYPKRLRQLAGDPRTAPRLAALAAMVVFAAAWRGTSAWLPAGDEPHYLVITQSLLRDGDLRIDDNHARRDYLEYYFSELKPDFLRRGTDGHIYSIHAPGVSALIAPAYAVGGYRAAAAFLLLVSAVGSALLWRLAWQSTGDPAAAWFGWAVVTLSAAVVTHAYTIYPDGPSSVLLLVALWGLVSAGSASTRSLVLASVAAAALPWLHTRNAVLAGAVGVAMVLRLWGRSDRWRAMAAYVAVPLASATVWFGSFRLIYGTFNPSAPYGGYAQSRPENLAAGLPGLLFDQQYGVFATAPAFAASVIGLGLALLARRADDGRVGERRRLAFELIAVCVPYVLAVAAYRMWWGGASAPARFLVPLLMPLGIPAAWAWRAARRDGDRAALAALLVLSAVWTAAMTWGGDGMLAFTTRAPYGPLQEWITRAVDVSSGLPSSFRTPPGVVVQLAIGWIAAALTAWLALRAVARSRQAAAAATPWVVAAAIMGALSLAWSVSGVSPLRPDSSRLAALLRIGHGAQAFVIGPRGTATVGPGRLFTAARALPLLQLQQVARGQVPKGQLASAAPLRAGAYRIVLGPALPPDAVVSVSVGRSDPVISRQLASVERGPDGRRAFTVDLPVEVNALVVSSDKTSSDTAAWIEPVRLGEGLEGFTRGRAATASRYGDLIAYFVTDRQFAESSGIWLRPDGESVIVVQPGEPRERITLYVRNGPTENTVSLRTAGASEQVSLSPGQERTFDVPLPGRRAAGLALSVARWFRPSDVEPGSDDVRRLGAWIEFRP